MKVSKYDFMFHKYYTGVTRVKMLVFARDGVVRTFDKLVNDDELINRVRYSKRPKNEDLVKLKKLVLE